jgi:hypothetical protein
MNFRDARIFRADHGAAAAGGPVALTSGGIVTDMS